MIGQNRQAAFQQAKADHDFTEQELELKTNTELTREIHTLTTELHSRLLDGGRSLNPSRQQSWSFLIAATAPGRFRPSRTASGRPPRLSRLSVNGGMDM